MIDNTLADYSAPTLDVCFVAAEQGFAGSSETQDLTIKEETWE